MPGLGKMRTLFQVSEGMVAYLFLYAFYDPVATFQIPRSKRLQGTRGKTMWVSLMESGWDHLRETTVPRSPCHTPAPTHLPLWAPSRDPAL